MSFSEDCVRFGDRLAKLVDAGVAVKDAAVTLGISRHRCYAILRATGRPIGSRGRRCGVSVDRSGRGGVHRDGLDQSGREGQRHFPWRGAAAAGGEAGLVSEDRQPRGKAAAGRRFLELLESGWSATRAAREVGVNERTARDWRDGIRKIRNTRICPDGTVIDYTTGTRYTPPVITTPSREAAGRSTAGTCRCRIDWRSLMDWSPVRR